MTMILTPFEPSVKMVRARRGESERLMTTGLTAMMTAISAVHWQAVRALLRYIPDPVSGPSGSSVVRLCGVCGREEDALASLPNKNVRESAPHAPSAFPRLLFVSLCTLRYTELGSAHRYAHRYFNHPLLRASVRG